MDKAITAISYVCDSADALSWGPQDAVKTRKKTQKNRGRGREEVGRDGGRWVWKGGGKKEEKEREGGKEGKRED